MPHDANGTPLKVGDKVLIEGHLAGIVEGSGYCNCTVELLHRMPPDMTVTVISSINTRQLISDEDQPEDPVNMADLAGEAEMAQEHAERVAFMEGATPLPFSFDPKDDPGNCAPDKSWPSFIGEALLYVGAALLCILGIYWIGSKASDDLSAPSSRVSPVEYAADSFDSDTDSWQRIIDTRRAASKWIRSQGLVTSSVECTQGRCEVSTPHNKWTLFCSPDCQIIGRSWSQ